MKPSEYAKAIVGAVVAGLTALGAALDADGVTAVEGVGVAVVTLSTFGSVFATRNTDPLVPRRRRHHHDEAGRGDVLYILAVIFVAVLLFAAVVSIFGGGQPFD